MGLLGNAAGGGGIASAFGGGLSSIAGLGGLVSGLLGLFGGGKTQPPPLVRFQLPAAQEGNISINGTQSSSQVYGSNLQASTSTAETKAPVQSTSSQQIVQTVKEALLNSSSLNDVIAEI